MSTQQFETDVLQHLADMHPAEYEHEVRVDNVGVVHTVTHAEGRTYRVRFSHISPSGWPYNYAAYISSYVHDNKNGMEAAAKALGYFTNITKSAD